MVEQGLLHTMVALLTLVAEDQATADTAMSLAELIARFAPGATDRPEWRPLVEFGLERLRANPEADVEQTMAVLRLFSAVLVHPHHQTAFSLTDAATFLLQRLETVPQDRIEQQEVLLRVVTAIKSPSASDAFSQVCCRWLLSGCTVRPEQFGRKKVRCDPLSL